MAAVALLSEILDNPWLCGQVHVLIGCEGHEAGLMQIVKRASKLLTPHCVFHGASNALLPKAQSYPVSGVEKGVRVDAGSPGLAASGIHSSTFALQHVLLLCYWSTWDIACSGVRLRRVHDGENANTRT